MPKSQKDQEEIVAKRLDLIAATLLALSGLKRSEIAEVLNVSEKTIERMFAGHLNRVRSIGHEKSK